MTKDKTTFKKLNQPSYLGDVSKRFYFRVSNAFKLAWLAFMKPDFLKENNFKMMSELLCLVLKVAVENRPMMTHIAIIHPNEDEEHEIVSIWAGAGIGVDPAKRISELIAENTKLKSELRKQSYKLKDKEII